MAFAHAEVSRTSGANMRNFLANLNAVGRRGSSGQGHGGKKGGKGCKLHLGDWDIET